MYYKFTLFNWPGETIKCSPVAEEDAKIIPDTLFLSREFQ